MRMKICLAGAMARQLAVLLLLMLGFRWQVEKKLEHALMHQHGRLHTHSEEVAQLAAQLLGARHFRAYLLPKLACAHSCICRLAERGLNKQQARVMSFSFLWHQVALQAMNSIFYTWMITHGAYTCCACTMHDGGELMPFGNLRHVSN